MTTRFDYVKYDDIAIPEQMVFKGMIQELQSRIEMHGAGEYQNHATKALEECYMWIGKFIREEQIRRNGGVELQEGRINS